MEMNTGGMQYQTSFPISFAQAEPVPVTIAAQPIQTTVQAEGCKPNCNFMKRWSLLNDLRQRHEYCDLVLVSSDKVTFQAHSIILASSSSFLHTAIQTLRSESYSTSGPQKLSIDGVGSDVLGIVLDCLYGVMPSSFEGILKLRMGAEALGLNAFFWPEANKPQMQVEQTIERDPPKPKAINQYGEEEMEEGDNGKTSDGLPLALAGTTSKSSPTKAPTLTANISYSTSGVDGAIESIVIEQVKGTDEEQGDGDGDTDGEDPSQSDAPPGYENLVSNAHFGSVFNPQSLNQIIQLEDAGTASDSNTTALQSQMIQQIDDTGNIYTLTKPEADGDSDNLLLTDQQENDMQQGHRKRRSRPDLWACNVRKAKKDKGEAYFTKSGRLVPAVVRSGPPCASVCPLRCSKKISEEDCNEIFTLFYKLGNKNKQDAYLYSLITRLEPKSRRNGNGMRARNNSFNYHICRKDGSLLRVCKNAFSSVFGVKESRLARLQNHRSKPATESTGPPVDMRGRHPNPKKTPDRIKNVVRRHILSYISAHKAAGQSESSLRLKPMWLDCVQQHEPTQIEMLQLGMKYSGRITQCLYRRIFRQEFKPILHMNDTPPPEPTMPSQSQMQTAQLMQVEPPIQTVTVTAQPHTTLQHHPQHTSTHQHTQQHITSTNIINVSGETIQQIPVQHHVPVRQMHQQLM